METPRDRLLRAYPTIADVGNALKVEKRTVLFDRKQALYMEQWPTVWELNDIYGDSGLRKRFAENCVSLAFFIKENAKPNDTVCRVHGDNFLLKCRNVQVSVVVCFFAEYQAKDTYGTKFDYSSFAKEFSTYCGAWERERGRLIGRQIEAEQDRMRQEWRNGGTGRVSMLEYLSGLRSKGIDITRSALYPSGKKVLGADLTGNPELKMQIDRIMGASRVEISEKATEDYLSLDDWHNEVAGRRAELPDFLLTADERKVKVDAAKQANEPFE